MSCMYIARKLFWGGGGGKEKEFAEFMVVYRVYVAIS